MTISNNFKMLFLSLTFISFISCSNNDDNDTGAGSNSEAIIKVEVLNTSNFTDFEESLSIQIIADNAKEINVTGETWDNIENPENVARWFTRYGEISTQNRTFITSKKVKSLTISNVTTPKVLNDNTTVKLNTTVNIYADNKLMKTEVFSASYGSSSTFTIPVVLGN
jgi:hypothetical protein